MFAYVTTVLSATNTRGTRLRVTDPEGVSALFAWDYALNNDDNHIAAAEALVAQRGVPHTRYASAPTAAVNGWVHLFT